MARVEPAARFGDIRLHNGTHYARIEGESAWWWDEDGFSPYVEGWEDTETQFPIRFIFRPGQRFIETSGPEPRPVFTLHYHDTADLWAVKAEGDSAVGFIAEKVLIDTKRFIELEPVPESENPQ